MAEYFDTYFFDKTKAEKVAKQFNIIDGIKNKIQLCYFNGEGQKDNCIGVPLDNLKQFFLNNSFRTPTHIDFTGSIYEDNEQEQDKIVELFYNIFQEIQVVKQATIAKLHKSYLSLEISKSSKNKIAFIGGKTQPDILKYFKHISKYFQYFNTLTLTQKSKIKMVLTIVSMEELYKFILKHKPQYLFFYNEFYPALIHKTIKHIYIVDSFRVCEKILDDTIAMQENKNIIFFVTSKLYKDILKLNNINSTLLPSYITKSQTLSNNKRKYKVLFIQNYLDISNYYLFEKVKISLLKKIQNNLLLLKDIQKALQDVNYPILDDLELNIYIQKSIISEYIVKKSKIDLLLIGSNWRLDNSKHIVKDSIKNSKKLYKQSSYVIVISYQLDSNEILSIIQQGAIPIVYDLREELNNYNKIIEDYCLYFKTLTDLELIINMEKKPKKKYDIFLYNQYKIENMVKIIENKLLDKR